MAKDLKGIVGYIYSGEIMCGNSRTKNWVVSDVVHDKENGWWCMSLRGLTAAGKMGSGEGSIRGISVEARDIDRSPRNYTTYDVKDGTTPPALYIAEYLRVPTKKDVRAMLLAGGRGDRELGLRATAAMSQNIDPTEAVMTSIRSLFDTPEWVSTAVQTNDYFIEKAERLTGAWLRSSMNLAASLLSLAATTPLSFNKGAFLLSMEMTSAAGELVKAAQEGTRAEFEQWVIIARSWMNATGEQREDGTYSFHCVTAQHEMALEENSTR